MGAIYGISPVSSGSAKLLRLAAIVGISSGPNSCRPLGRDSPRKSKEMYTKWTSSCHNEPELKKKISKQNWRAVTSPKKQTDKFAFLSWQLGNTWNMNFDFKFQVYIWKESVVSNSISYFIQELYSSLKNLFSFFSWSDCIEEVSNIVLFKMKQNGTKGQIISKCLLGVFNFFQKTKENTSHSSKNEFICSFFWRLHCLTICFRN